MFQTGSILHPGDLITYVITANDPHDNKLNYGFSSPVGWTIWQDDNSFSFKIENQHIGKNRVVTLFIRTLLDYHAYHSSDDFDDDISFIYNILPLNPS